MRRKHRLRIFYLSISFYPMGRLLIGANGIKSVRFRPISEISSRLPDVDYDLLKKTVRRMASEGELVFSGGRKYRKYDLP